MIHVKPTHGPSLTQPSSLDPTIMHEMKRPLEAEEEEPLYDVTGGPNDCGTSFALQYVCTLYIRSVARFVLSCHYVAADLRSSCAFEFGTKWHKKQAKVQLLICLLHAPTQAPQHISTKSKLMHL